MWKCPKCGREFGRQEQDHYCVKPETVDAYIAAQEEAVQPRLRELRAILQAALPDAQERISWSMPTYLKGRNISAFRGSVFDGIEFTPKCNSASGQNGSEALYSSGIPHNL
jgi:uncharacterized protein YdhG (YjbR/CyaY superfamily)